MKVLIRINHLQLELFSHKCHQQEVSLSLDFFPALDHEIFALQGPLRGPESSGACSRVLSSINIYVNSSVSGHSGVE